MRQPICPTLLLNAPALTTVLHALTARPAVYFMVRERQLSWQIHAAAAHGEALWRPQPAASGAAALLRRRGAAPLNVRVPVTSTGVDTADSVVYVCSIESRCSRAGSPAAAAASAAAVKSVAGFVAPPPRAVPPLPLSVPVTWAPCAGAGALAPVALAAKPTQLLRLATPPALQEQARPGMPPYKRSRLDPTSEAAAHHGYAAVPAGTMACLPAPTSCAPVVPAARSPHDTWVVVSQPPLQQQQPRPQQQTGAEDPHGVLSWLRKIRGMLEHPAAAAPVYC